MIEYGIFEDGACIEAGFFEREEAEKRVRFYSAEPAEDGYTVEEICPDHEDQPRHGCEDCGQEGGP